MGCLVVFLGLAVFFWSIFTVGGIFVTVENPITENIGYLILTIFIETALIILFILCIKKYQSPERKQARETKRAEEKARWEEAQRQRKEAERLRTTIVATRLIGEGSAEYKKSVGSMVVRGAIGGFFGGAAGAALGAASAASKNTNKNVRRFLVKYLDGHIEEKEATIGSAQYKEYMAHLEWGDGTE
jgi:hypothetical protein